MSDQFEQVSEQGFGSNLMESIKGVATGGLLFVLSFVVLWKNEGCTDYAKVAKQSVSVKADAIDKSADGKFISVTGDLKSEGKLEDPEFLQPGDYVSLSRDVEMYAWVEKKSKEEKKKVGGSKEVKTTYTYEKRWTDDPDPSSKFEYPKGHENPSLDIKSQRWTADKASIGAYPFKASDATLPSGEALKLTDAILKGQGKADKADKTDKAEGDKADSGDADKADKGDADKGDGDKAKGDDAKKDDAADDDAKPKKGKKGKKRHGRKVRTAKPTASEKQDAAGAADRKAAAIASRRPDSYNRASDTYLFRGTGSLDAPEIGDIRIGFKVLLPGQKLTLFGTLHDGEVMSYVKDDVKFFRALRGSREEAIQTLATEDSIRAWGLRLLGFLMMWFGLTMFFGPINTLLDVIPFLGSAGRFLIGLAMFPVSLLLSGFTILLAVIFHNTILLVLFLVAMGAGGFFLYQKKKKGA